MSRTGLLVGVAGACFGLAGLALDPAPAEGAPCAASPAAEGGRVRVALFRGADVSEATVWTEVGRARETLGALGVDLLQVGSLGVVPAEVAIGGDPGATDPEAAGRALDPARSIVSGLLPGLPAGVIPVVFLTRVMALDSPLRRVFTRLRGWTAADPALLGLPGAPPVVFLSVADLQFAPGTVDVTLAHELAHARGLAHVADPSNLLYDGEFSCRPVLRPEQLAAFSE